MSNYRTTFSKINETKASVSFATSYSIKFLICSAFCNKYMYIEKITKMHFEIGNDIR